MKSARFEPNERRQKDIEALRVYIAALADGAHVSWVEVTQASGVEMNARGKALVSLVAKRLRRPYLSLPGDGIAMSSTTNALDIVGGKTKRFIGALAIAKETTEQVAGRHMNELPQAEKNRLMHHQAVFATLALSASLSKKLPA